MRVQGGVSFSHLFCSSIPSLFLLPLFRLPDHTHIIHRKDQIKGDRAGLREGGTQGFVSYPPLSTNWRRQMTPVLIVGDQDQVDLTSSKAQCKRLERELQVIMGLQWMNRSVGHLTIFRNFVYLFICIFWFFQMFMENDPRAVSMHLQHREIEHELNVTKQLNVKLQKHNALLDVHRQHM